MSNVDSYNGKQVTPSIYSYTLKYKHIKTFNAKTTQCDIQVYDSTYELLVEATTWWQYTNTDRLSILDVIVISVNDTKGNI